jgi:putative ABC transport system ATP-binding protein
MIKLKDLTKIFSDSRGEKNIVLDKINLEIKSGETALFKGESGSGKSTLLSIIALLLKPTSGSVIIDGEIVSKLPDIHASRFRLKKIGFVPQAFNLIPGLTLKENLTIPQTALGISPKKMEQNIEIALERAQIEHKKDQDTALLSGGERQRGAIARALVNDPDVLIFDEPTANLDRDNSIKFIRLLEELTQLKKTTLLATHDAIFDQLSIIDKAIELDSLR